MIGYPMGLFEDGIWSGGCLFCGAVGSLLGFLTPARSSLSSFLNLYLVSALKRECPFLGLWICFSLRSCQMSFMQSADFSVGKAVGVGYSPAKRWHDKIGHGIPHQ